MTREWRVGLPDRRPRLRRASLERDAIVNAAIAIIDRDGAEALSMRRLAHELGSGATSAYRHVRDKDELLALAFDAVTSEIALPDPNAPWDEALAASATGLRQLFHRHPSFVLLIGHRSVLGPGTLAIVERLLGILRRSGFGDEMAYHAISAVANYATGFTILEVIPRLRGRDGLGVPEYRKLLTEYLAGPYARKYPNAAAVAPAMVGREDADFEFGVRAIVAGIREIRGADGADGDAAHR